MARRRDEPRESMRTKRMARGICQVAHPMPPKPPQDPPTIRSPSPGSPPTFRYDLRFGRRHLNSMTTPNSKSTDHTFTLFSKLPLEIQEYIWKIICESHPQRVVTVYGQEVLEDPWLSWTGFVSPAPIPAALHTCSLARRIALRSYKLCFGMMKEGTVVKPMIYFNYQKDILYFREDRQLRDTFFFRHRRKSCFEPFFSLVNRSDIDKVKCLGFESKIPGTMHYSFYTFHNDLKLWNALKQVYLGYEKPKLDHRKTMGFDRLRRNQWSFARSFCDRHSTNSPLTCSNLGGAPTYPEILTHDNYEVLLERAKNNIENGNTTGFSEQRLERVMPKWEINFGTFRNV